MSQKWNSDKTIKFLEAYEQCPCLWDVHNNAYKNKLAREKAYLKMAKIVNIDNFTVANVKAKIRSTRNAYALELSKISKSKKSGVGADKVYKPRVLWFTVADRILHKVVQRRESDIIIKIEDSEEHSANTINLRDISHDEMLLPSSVDTVVPTPSTSRTITTLQNAPKRIKKIEQNNTDLGLRELTLISKTLNQSLPNENEYDFFGKSLACQLQKLPESVAVESMAFIQAYLTQQKLSVINPPAAERSSETSSTRSSYEYHDSDNIDSLYDV